MSGIVHESVLTNVSVNTAVFDDVALDIARDFLEGYTGEYYFFQRDLDTFLLLYDAEDPQWVSSPFAGFNCSSCNVFQIDRVVSDINDIRDSISGTMYEIGTDTAIQRFSGNYTHRDLTYAYKTAVFSVHNVSVSNPDDFLVFSSADDYPHLIEGVQNYAFAGFMLAVGVIVFRLADKLFRRVY